MGYPTRTSAANQARLDYLRADNAFQNLKTSCSCLIQLLTTYKKDVPPYRILFRASKIGPNAFALPSGDIVLTDQIVRLAADDDAIMGIRGHELGHVRQRHIMRRLIQGAATAALAAMLVGDISAVAANLPAVLLDMAYSREAEREADDEAIQLLTANNLPLEAFAHLFESLAHSETEAGSYLSSHPAPTERIARIRSFHPIR